MKTILALLVLLSSLGFGEELKVNRQSLEQYVKKVEKDNRIPAGLLHSFILIESNYNHLAVNPKSKERSVAVTSFGLGQITEDTAIAMCGFSVFDLYDPYKNIDCSVIILKYQLNRFKRKIPMVVSAYNSGTPCVCDGKLYTMAWRISHKDHSVTQQRTCYTRKFTGKKSITVPATCTNKEIGRFLNQEYVDKFFLTWKHK